MNDSATNLRLFILESPYLQSIQLGTALDQLPGIEVVSRLHNCDTAMQLMQVLGPDIVMVDMDQENVETVESLVRANTSTRVITLANHCDATSIARLLGCGVRGHCHKDSRPDRLYLAVLTASNGGLWIDEKFAGDFSLYVEHAGANNGANNGAKNGAPDPAAQKANQNLSDRDREILKLIASGATNREIASQLFLSISTIKADLHRMVDFFKVKDRTEAAVFAARHGLI